MSFTVHQFHYRASQGEAVTDHLLFIQEALKEIGVGGKVFAVERKNLAQGKIQNFSFDSVWDCDLLLIHHSQENPFLKKLIALEIPKAIVYHSQPEPSYFSHDWELRQRLSKGKAQLKWLAKKNIPVFAVSQFCEMELKRLGFESVKRLPLLHLDGQTKNAHWEKSASEPLQVLFVGKLSPHKNQAALLDLFQCLKPKLSKKSKLVLVGSGDLLYTKYLKLLIEQYGLCDQVVLTGKITSEDLDHYYSSSDLFVCLSESEGFCLPVVEAMNWGVPVFYWPCAGVKETMREAGVAFHTQDPSEQASVIQAFLKTPKALQAVIKKQNERVQELTRFQNKQILQGLFKRNGEKKRLGLRDVASLSV